VSDLVVGPVCTNLVRIFQLSERARKAPVVAHAVVEARPVARLALAGAGVMGGGIAELASRHGIEVRMRDVNASALTRALQTARGVIEGRWHDRGPAAALARERDAQLARILPTLEPTGFTRVDFIVEAVVEDLDVKRRVLAELEVRARPDAVIATNTSSLSVSALAGGLQRPERFCGLHFFHPVHRMPLVEVVRGERTSDETLVTAVALARRLGKTPVVVNDAPGFVVNRILMSYLREALHLLEEGYPLRDSDASMRCFGMPVGPFEVVDAVGVDVAHAVAGILGRAFPGRMSDAPALGKLAAAGRLGKKSGLGFYRHAGGKHSADPGLRAFLGLERERRGHTLESLSERMVMATINEAARCLEDGVVADAGAVDLAMILGAGFPPFRGGPLRYADSLGLGHVESRLTALRAEKGERFAPCEMVARLAREGGSFTGAVAAA
jgi:3-hydroxyacyl-CoA dehydrogenase